MYPVSTASRAPDGALDAYHRLNRVRHIDVFVDYREDRFSPAAVGDDEVAEGAVVVRKLQPLRRRIGSIPDLAERDIGLPGYLPHRRLRMRAIEVTDATAHHGLAGTRHRPRKTKSWRNRGARVVRAQGVDLRTKIQFAEVRCRRQVHGFGGHVRRRPDDDRKVVVVTHAEVEHEIRADPPVILKESADLVELGVVVGGSERSVDGRRNVRQRI